MIDSDLISRQAAIIALSHNKCGNDENDIAVQRDIETIRALEAVNPLKWIPCSKRLPKEDTDVLIAYRYKEGEGDTIHTEINITSYGQMYSGIGIPKHWRPPFEYFASNYEVVAWMPLPEPYREE